ncbi:TPA: hypothetical protein I2U21_12820 [Staphylococcus aureus]|nr:hypothetical protein [Staphylococcus aureus]
MLRIPPAKLTRSGNSPLDDQSTTASISFSSGVPLISYQFIDYYVFILSFSSNILHVHSTIYMDCLTCNIFCFV